MELSKKLLQYPQFIQGEFVEESIALKEIENLESQIKTETETYNNLSEWVSKNFKKELPYNENDTIEKFKSELSKEETIYNKEKSQLTEIYNWSAIC